MDNYQKPTFINFININLFVNEIILILGIMLFFKAGVVELVDTLDLGSSIERCESSSLSFRTIFSRKKDMFCVLFFMSVA